MKAAADKTPDNKIQSITKETTQALGGGEGLAQFTDNRSTTTQLQQLQGMANQSAQVGHIGQLQAMAHGPKTQEVVQKQKNDTGMPDNLKSGIENLSGMSMDDVKVHRNSDKPAQLNAHAYAQGSEIHLASGQEKHLPHEAWHVVQQKQGRVKPTMQMKGKVNVNDDIGLEKEADVMGMKAVQFVDNPTTIITQMKSQKMVSNVPQVSQLGLFKAKGDNGLQAKQIAQLHATPKFLVSPKSSQLLPHSYPIQRALINGVDLEDWDTKESDVVEVIVNLWDTQTGTLSPPGVSQPAAQELYELFPKAIAFLKIQGGPLLLNTLKNIREGQGQQLDPEIRQEINQWINGLAFASAVSPKFLSDHVASSSNLVAARREARAALGSKPSSTLLMLDATGMTAVLDDVKAENTAIFDSREKAIREGYRMSTQQVRYVTVYANGLYSAGTTRFRYTMVHSQQGDGWVMHHLDGLINTITLQNQVKEAPLERKRPKKPARPRSNSVGSKPAIGSNPDIRPDPI